MIKAVFCRLSVVSACLEGFFSSRWFIAYTLIVKVMAKDNPMYAMDKNDMLIASGGTAGYCAISQKSDSPYELEYIQAWLANSYTEKLFNIVGKSVIISKQI